MNRCRDITSMTLRLRVTGVTKTCWLPRMRTECRSGIVHIDGQLIGLNRFRREFCTLGDLENKNSSDSEQVGTAQRRYGKKRFYRNVGIASSTTLGRKGVPSGFCVVLDGRPIKTPHKNFLVLRTQSLAQAVANEWEMQTEWIVPAMMPLMTLSCTAIDIAEKRRQSTEEELLQYLYTDTLLFPAIPGIDDPALLALQKQHWMSLLDWFSDKFGPLSTCEGVVIPNHPEETLNSVGSLLNQLSAANLCAIESLTRGCKSLIVALALFHGKISVADAVKAARVEEEHQISQWGLVEGSHDVDRTQLISEVSAASFFLQTN